MASIDRLGTPLRDDPYRGNCRVVSTSNITLSGLQTIDGVTLESGNRVLVQGQSTTSQNGIYIAKTGTWQRARDLATSDDFKGPILVTVEEGTTNKNTFWSFLPTTTIDVGTTAVTFSAGWPAATMANTPAGNIVATTVQAAINELDADKLAKAGGTVTGDVEMNAALLRLIDPAFAPPEYASTPGASVGTGPLYMNYVRTGGYPAYGAILVNYTVTSASVSQLDSAFTQWATHTNLQGGSVFGLWCGANSPSQQLGQTFSGGRVVGAEINAGNRWADFGLKDDVSDLDVTALQVVPDVLPATQGESPATTFPATFGVVYGPSVHGHRMWTVSLIRQNTVPAGGRLNFWNGGSNVGNAAASFVKTSGYFVDGIDTSGATFSGALIKPASSGQDIGTTTARIRALYTQGLLVVDDATSGSQTNDSTLKVANTAGASLRVGFSGGQSNYLDGANFYMRNAGATQDLLRLEASTGNLTPEYAGGTRSLGTSGKPWGPLHADSATLGAPLPIASGGTGQTTAAEAIGEMTQALAANTSLDFTSDALPMYDAGGDTGEKITPENLAKGMGVQRLLFYRLGANLNSTADQQLTKVGSFSEFATTNGSVTFILRSGTSASAVGGIYTASAKGGQAFVSAAQTYSAMTATGRRMTSTPQNNIPANATDLYFSLTTPEGSAATMDIFVFGYVVS